MLVIVIGESYVSMSVRELLQIDHDHVHVYSDEPTSLTNDEGYRRDQAADGDSAIRVAASLATAMIVCCGLTPRLLGKTLLSTTYRPRKACA